MPLGREYGEIVAEDVRENPDYARDLFGEALRIMLEGDTTTAKVMLRDLVNGTVGFVALAEETGISDKSLHRMLGPNGNPRLENLSAISKALSKALGATLRVDAVAVVQA